MNTRKLRPRKKNKTKYVDSDDSITILSSGSEFDIEKELMNNNDSDINTSSEEEWGQPRINKEARENKRPPPPSKYFNLEKLERSLQASKPSTTQETVEIVYDRHSNRIGTMKINTATKISSRSAPTRTHSKNNDNDNNTSREVIDISSPTATDRHGKEVDSTTDSDSQPDELPELNTPHTVGEIAPQAVTESNPDNNDATAPHQALAESDGETPQAPPLTDTTQGAEKGRQEYLAGVKGKTADKAAFFRKKLNPCHGRVAGVENRRCGKFARIENKYATQSSEQWECSKWDYSHLIKNKYRGKFGPRPPKSAKTRSSEKLREILQKDTERLGAPSLKESTKKQMRSHHRFFDTCMADLGEDNIPTPETCLLAIAQMARMEYSVQHIMAFVTALKRHPNMTMNPDQFSSNVQLRNALANIRKEKMDNKDCRVPMSIAMAKEFCSILDRDFSVKTALSCKAAIWLSYTGMLCCSKAIISTT